MRFTADRAQLLEAVGRVQSAAGNGKSIPILGMLLLRTAGDSVALRATDNTVEATARANATVEKEGAICVPAGQLHELLRSLPDGAEVAFTKAADDPRLRVECARSKFKLPTFPADDFPKLPDVEAGVAGAIRADTLARLIDKTLFAASNEETRYYLRGLLLHVVAGPAGPLLRAAATDGIKLAYAQAPCPEALAGLEPVIVPTRFAVELRRWLGALTCDVELCASPRRLRVVVGEGRLQGAAIEGRYPNYQRIVPQPPHAAEFDLALLRQAVRRAVITTTPTEKAKIRVVRLELLMGRATISGRSVERGEAQEDLEVELTGPPTTLTCNAGQLLDVAERIGGERLRLCFTGAADPIVVVDPSDPEVLFLMTTVLG